MPRLSHGPPQTATHVSANTANFILDIDLDDNPAGAAAHSCDDTTRRVVEPPIGGDDRQNSAQAQPSG